MNIDSQIHGEQRELVTTHWFSVSVPLFTAGMVYFNSSTVQLEYSNIEVFIPKHIRIPKQVVAELYPEIFGGYF